MPARWVLVKTQNPASGFAHLGTSRALYVQGASSLPARGRVRLDVGAASRADTVLVSPQPEGGRLSSLWELVTGSLSGGLSAMGRGQSLFFS